MMISENAIRLSLVCISIGVGLGIDLAVDSEIVSNVHDLLRSLKCPLKATIVTCWSLGIVVRIWIDNI